MQKQRFSLHTHREVELQLTSAVCGDEWLASYAGRFTSLGKSPPVTTGLETGCIPSLVWTVWRRENFLSSGKIRTHDRHCSYQLPRNLGTFHYNNYNNSFLVLYHLPREGVFITFQPPPPTSILLYRFNQSYLAAPNLLNYVFFSHSSVTTKPTVYIPLINLDSVGVKGREILPMSLFMQ